MPIPDASKRVFEIRLNGLIAAAGSNAVRTTNIFHYYRTTNTNPVTKDPINVAFDTVVLAGLCTALNARWTGETEEIRCIDDAEDQYTVYTPMNGGVQAVGLVSGDSMPTVNICYHNWKSALRGKHWRGNKKVGPLSESDTTAATADILNATGLARQVGFAGACLAGFTDSNGNVWRPVVVSKELSTLRTNPTTVVYQLVTQVLVNKRIGRMKRREVSSVY